MEKDGKDQLDQTQIKRRGTETGERGKILDEYNQNKTEKLGRTCIEKQFLAKGYNGEQNGGQKRKRKAQKEVLAVRDFSAPAFRRDRFGATVSAPGRFGAGRFGAGRFGAKILTVSETKTTRGNTLAQWYVCDLWTGFIPIPITDGNGLGSLNIRF